MTIDTIIKKGVNLSIPVKGSSMFPVLRTGDSVIVTYSDNFKKGDIILFRKDEKIVCHRVRKIMNREGKFFYVTGGDSLFREDGHVSAEDIIGKVLYIKRSSMSIPRRVLLFLYPFLRPRILNAILVNMLVKVKQLTLLKSKACQLN